MCECAYAFLGSRDIKGPEVWLNTPAPFGVWAVEPHSFPMLRCDGNSIQQNFFFLVVSPTDWKRMHMHESPGSGGLG
jgi:hypothetical protein